MAVRGLQGNGHDGRSGTGYNVRAADVAFGCDPGAFGSDGLGADISSYGVQVSALPEANLR
jgi:hypothetical protein